MILQTNVILMGEHDHEQCAHIPKNNQATFTLSLTQHLEGERVGHGPKIETTIQTLNISSTPLII
jgi:hypothetical protein